MTMALMEVERCYDIECKYICEEEYCPDDWFDDETHAKCEHPAAPSKNFLGSSDDRNYLKIPEWCPLRKG